MSEVIRIQDKYGRGPYKPGFSHKWSEYRCLIAEPNKKPFMDEFPEVQGKIQDIFEKNGVSFGCAFRTLKQLDAWFTPAELEKLWQYGYALVTIDVDEILAESDNQLVFWCKRPLKEVAKPFALFNHPKDGERK